MKKYYIIYFILFYIIYFVLIAFKFVKLNKFIERDLLFILIKYI